MESIRAFLPGDLEQITELWNGIVRAGDSFPQTDPLDLPAAARFFGEQTFTGVYAPEGEVLGLYILHPNNVGRCGHIANASYAVRPGQRGRRIGERLVLHSLARAREAGFRILQFNAVVATNEPALKLYERLGFTRLGTIPGGFLSREGVYLDIIPHFISLADS